MQDLVGRAWGRFLIIEERGRGGMAVVYRAYDNVLQRTVALKVLLPHLAANVEFTRRFEREAITAANLRHPNVVIIYDVGSHESFQYIVMEYLDGPTLQQEIQKRGSLPINRVIPIIGQLASALDYAHQQGLVHRDVKPANVLVGTRYARDHITLTDFGLVKAASMAKITGEGTTSGTLRYMSPEQAMGKELDGRSDVYSLGVIAYEMLGGETPFSAAAPYQVLRELINKPPPPLSPLNPSVNTRLEQAVFRALAKEPAARFGTAGEFASALASASGVGLAADDEGSKADTESRRREIVLFLTSPDGRQYPVYRGRVTVGRGADNDIVLPVSQVSRQHASIQCDREACLIVDDGSTNGTFVNGFRLPVGTPWPLQSGDLLVIGPVNLLVVLPTSRIEAAGTDTLPDQTDRREFHTARSVLGGASSGQEPPLHEEPH
ncbi:MAG: protein kinase [Anaerolineae bacterium]|nr:protein kinase [Anaerolineae bacterium]